MMDIQKLKALAQAVIDASTTKRTLTVSTHAIALSEFEHTATPELIISLIGRLEKAEAKLEGLRKRGADYILYQCADCDQETLNYTTHCKNCGSTDIIQKELFTRPAPPDPVKLPIAKHFGVIGTDEVCRAYPADAVIEAIKAAGGSVADE